MQRSVQRARGASWVLGRGKAAAGPICLFLIVAVAATLRIHGLNWDEGHWLHPDERQIFFVVEDLGWPSSVAEALGVESPLNPHFFAYGSLPIYLLKLAAFLLAFVWPAAANPDNLHLVARPLAVLFDLGTVFLTYRLAGAILPSPRGPSSPAASPGASSTSLSHTEAGAAPVPSGSGGAFEGPVIHVPALIAAAFVSLAVIHVQIAHFYTVDTLLTLLAMLTLYLAWEAAREPRPRHLVALGIAFGLALATKVTAVLLFPALLLALVTGSARALDGTTQHQGWRDLVMGWLARWSLSGLGRFFLVVAIAAIVFVLAQPYSVIDWHAFLERTIRESAIAWGRRDVPYTRQFAGTWPFLYSIWQMTLWGVGLPVGLVLWAGFFATSVRWLRRGALADGFLLAWAAPYLVFAGLLHARYLRYMLPVVPVLCILAVRALLGLKRKRLRQLAQGILLAASLAYCLAFESVYSTPHSWIQASEWIYRQIPAHSTLAIEEWDRALPLPREVDGQDRRRAEYVTKTLALYDEPDDAEKWEILARDLSDSDYVILASRRLYGSIPRLPDRYPVTSRYYEQLLSGELGFELVAEFTRGPAWLNPRLPPLPGAVPEILRPDESFFVYDHPRALVLKNAGMLRAPELLERLQVR